MVTLGLAARVALKAWIGPSLTPYVTFYPAVMVVALLAGLGPGLLTTALVILVEWTWILPDSLARTSDSPAVRMGLVVFGGMGIFMSAVAGLYRRDRDKPAAYDREAALREGRARLATFAEATFEGIVESEGGTILDCNEQLARMVGYPAADLKGMRFDDLVAPSDRARAVASALGTQASTDEFAMLRKDGTRIIVEAHGRIRLAGKRDAPHRAPRHHGAQKGRGAPPRR